MLYDHKSDEKDLVEYQHFTKEILDRFPRERMYLERAYLLQFARKKPQCFPEQAQVVMEYLRKEHFIECLLFDAIERLGYVHYAIEQRIHFGNEKILTDVLKNQAHHFARLADEIPGFKREFWPDDIQEALS